MSNLISLENAAKMLGLSVDKLNEYREDSEIFGYKDAVSYTHLTLPTICSV